MAGSRVNYYLFGEEKSIGPLFTNGAVSNRTHQDLRDYAHALKGTSLRELVDDSLRFCVLCGCVGVIGEGVCVFSALSGPR